MSAEPFPDFGLLAELGPPTSPPPPSAPRPAPIRHTEQTMIDRLVRRYSKTSQNGAWVGHKWMWAAHVPNKAIGYGDRRIADFVAVDTAASKTLEMDVFEVKISRGDFLRELREPEKPEAFRPYARRFWYVVPEFSIVQGDLPDWAGLMVAVSTGALRISKPAPVNQLVEPMPYRMVTTVMRSIQQAGIEHGGSGCDCSAAQTAARQLLTSRVDPVD